jgi:hypothetical protein
VILKNVFAPRDLADPQARGPPKPALQPPWRGLDAVGVRGDGVAVGRRSWSCTHTSRLTFDTLWQAKLELQFDMETEAGKIGPVEKARGPKPATPFRPPQLRPAAPLLPSSQPRPQQLACRNPRGDGAAARRGVAIVSGGACGSGAKEGRRVTEEGVGQVTIFERHEEGPIAIKFKEAAHAEQCNGLMHGRWFGGRQLACDFWDGTNYVVKVEKSLPRVCGDHSARPSETIRAFLMCALQPLRLVCWQRLLTRKI